jgi:peptidoglycan hydrolase-like protein with peptidoglycan-binding domain
MADHPTIKKGSKGDAVKLAQTRLTERFYYFGPIDGLFGPQTEAAVLNYQWVRLEANGGGGSASFPLKVDGIVGPKTWFRLDPPTVKKGDKGDKGDAVKMLQELLISYGYNPGPADGIFGPQTESALKAMQSDYGLKVDGIAGPVTWAALGS